MRALFPFASLCTLLLAGGCGSASEPQSAAEPTSTPTEVAKSEEPAPAAEEPAAEAPAENAAPDFTLADLAGAEHSLAAHRGKTVILEWFNPGCPFVKHAHSKGPLKTMAKEKMGEGIVWLAINSGAPGKQGHGVERNKKAKGKWEIPNPILVDEQGEVGKAYGAKTTPHMYVIDERGAIIYRGAIDNAPLGKVPDEGHVNYVDKALADLAAERPVEIAETQSYGCSVKYAN